MNITESNSLVRDLKYDRFGNYAGHSQSPYSGCGYFELNTTVDNTQLHDSKAWAIKTTFMFPMPVLHQVYLLIAHDLEHLLGGNYNDWNSYNSSNLLNSSYIHMAAKSLIATCNM